MAGDWLQWTKGLTRKREVVLMAARLNVTRKEVAASLMELWEWCDDNIPDASIDAETGDADVTLGPDAAAFLDSVAGLKGVAEAMASPEVGWLLFRSAGRVVFPRLGRHNGQTAKTRALSAKRASRYRNAKSNGASVTPSSLSLVSGSGPPVCFSDGGAGEGGTGPPEPMAERSCRPLGCVHPDAERPRTPAEALQTPVNHPLAKSRYEAVRAEAVRLAGLWLCRHPNPRRYAVFDLAAEIAEKLVSRGAEHAARIEAEVSRPERDATQPLWRIWTALGIDDERSRDFEETARPVDRGRKGRAQGADGKPARAPEGGRAENLTL